MKVFFTNFRRSFLSIGLIELVFTLAIQFLYQKPFKIRSLIDGLSTISLLFLCLGLIIFVLQGGFFDGMIYSFKRFARSIRNRQLGEDEAETPLKEYKHRDGKRSPIIWPLIFDSLFLFIVSLVISFL
ncbi:DUF3899 domain-containing protein [Sporolactobacillus laevolacticus]|uniref:DUF3899 domain-containing protein n=1 Tax=Sporolactobacillus laevolacticus TaxID=33018 RepID=UPI0025B4302A|nr:DUF3899 domain-containing protein [Sporolactobacillus laevolacticus]MDN3954203.1 DUF3899 domain-containing protein [Sporolactobacillus laevolacticus]